MATRQCKNSPDLFCYICGYYILKKQFLQKKYKITKGSKVWIAYRLYFGMSICDQDKPWVPHVVCGTCRSSLEGWLGGRKRVMPFALPRLWKEPKNHHDDCYFCMVDLTQYVKVKRRHALSYPNIPSSTAPVPHDDNLPVPQSPQNANYGMDISSEESTNSINRKMTEDSVPTDTSEPHFPNQSELDDLIRDLGLTKSEAELLSSRLKEWNLLGEDCKTYENWQQHEKFDIYYDISKNLCYCKDVIGLFTAIGFKHDPAEWRLFIDSSIQSLKAVLIHNGNKYPSLPLAYSIQKKEQYDNVKELLDKINYAEFKWDVYGDFKMFTFLFGMQGGYTKYSCFLCLWDSRAENTNRSPQIEMQPVILNIFRQPLVDSNKILLPPFHIKLGLIKQFLKVLDFEGKAFQEIVIMFPKLAVDQIKKGLFDSSQINAILKSKKLESAMTEAEKNVWCAFRDVIHGFPKNHKDPNYKQLVAKFTEKLKKIGCNMSLTVHFLYSHLDFLSKYLGDISEEHVEKFHQNIASMEKIYKGRWNTSLMGDYVWSLVKKDKNRISL